jgi:hypothetical protein
MSEVGDLEYLCAKGHKNTCADQKKDAGQTPNGIVDGIIDLGNDV